MRRVFVPPLVSAVASVLIFALALGGADSPGESRGRFEGPDAAAGGPGAAPASSPSPSPSAAPAATAIFDGESLAGWRRMNEPGHASGCIWSVRDGAIDGVQEYPGAWGILATEKEYGDFELSLEVKAEAPFDAGVIVRSTAEGHGYLIRIHPALDGPGGDVGGGGVSGGAAGGGDVGGIAGSRIGGFGAPAREWKKAWRKDGYNDLRILVEGQPPELRTWLNGTPMAELRGPSTDSRVRAAGRIALKLGGEEGCFSDHIFFRNIRIRDARPGNTPREDEGEQEARP